MDSWKQARDADAAEESEQARAILVGKTIVAADVVPVDDDHDDLNVLRLTLSDGTVAQVLGAYSEDYSGHSKGEFPQYVTVFVAAQPRPEAGDLEATAQ